MKKYKITIERPARIEETWVIETELPQSTGKLEPEQLNKWLDDNAEQLGTEVFSYMDEEERRMFGFEIYLNNIEEVA